MTGERWGVGRSRAGWGEGDDWAEWGVTVAVATRDRLVSSEPSVGASLRLLAPTLSPPARNKVHIHVHVHVHVQVHVSVR